MLMGRGALQAQAADAAPPAGAPAGAEDRQPGVGAWVFSWLPTAFQKNPYLNETVITEMTDLGRRLPPVSPQAPAYYVVHTAGPIAQGQTYGGEMRLDADRVRALLAASLARAGYLPADPPQSPPTLLIVYTWGSANAAVDAPVAGLQGLLNRAALVGGEKFAREIADLEQRTADFYVPPPHQIPAVPGGGAPMAAPSAIPEFVFEFANPINRFVAHSGKNEFLWSQVNGELYFVVASAYDYRAAALHARRLLWRTRMTVAAEGVSEEMALPKLILSAASFYGREMNEPEVFVQRALPEVKVEIGTPKVLEMPAGEDRRQGGRGSLRD